MLTTERYDDTIERLLDEPFFVIDFLPRQVPAGSGGHYFAVEEYFMEGPLIGKLYENFAELILKLNCYYDLITAAGEHAAEEMPPEKLWAEVTGCTGSDFLNIMLPGEDSLITLYAGDLYMTLYHPSEELLETVRQLAGAQGLFVRSAS